MSKLLRTILLAASIVFATTGSTSNGLQDWGGLPSHDATAQATPLSVMTYNLEGLPWPIATGRPEALNRIAARLGALRRAGRQPHIVLLQEAFTPDAQAIIRSTGYRYAASGPDVTPGPSAAPSGGNRRFLAAARWDRGEQIGKWLGSGLMILSDYPIVRVDRFAFPDAACAGFDCLANKGAVIAHLDVPGFALPVAIVDTHLNARKAAGVPLGRSQEAYTRQAGLLAQFVADMVQPRQALMMGGDMNIGYDPERARAFFTAFDRVGLDFVTPDASGLRRALAQNAVHDPRSHHDLSATGLRRKDWVFARGSTGEAMPVIHAHVPFGSEHQGAPLSDHVGYVIDYASPASTALASNAGAAPVGALR